MLVLPPSPLPRTGFPLLQAGEGWPTPASGPLRNVVLPLDTAGRGQAGGEGQ
jgi:hypothetical protein